MKGSYPTAIIGLMHRRKKKTPSTPRAKPIVNRPSTVPGTLEHLKAQVAAHIEWLRLNPRKSDFVDSNGMLLPIPDTLLRTEADVLAMFKELHFFCHNSLPHRRGLVFCDHWHPIDCLMYMYGFGCISLGELRAILRLPIQIRLIHERLYHPSVLEVFPYRRFIVEFVEMTCFILKMRGIKIPEGQRPRRYNYCWNPWEPPASVLPTPADDLAASYEKRLLHDARFRAEWSSLKQSVPTPAWAYCTYDDWFLVMNENGDYDAGNTTHLIGSIPSMKDKNGEVPGRIVIAQSIRAFCDKWGLTHLGRTLLCREDGNDVYLRPGHVTVVPKQVGLNPVPPIHPPVGFTVQIPAFYGFSHISRLRSDDFQHLKYAMDIVRTERVRIASMSDQEKKAHLRCLKQAVRKCGMGRVDVYRILKCVCLLSGGASDGTMKKLGFRAPQVPLSLRYRNNTDVLPVAIDEAFSLILNATKNRPVEFTSAMESLAAFGVDVDFRVFENGRKSAH